MPGVFHAKRLRCLAAAPSLSSLAPFLFTAPAPLPPAGGDYSTKLAPWLAHGCLSPRSVYYDIKRYERQTGTANKSTYWVVFELIWRDFYRWGVGGE